MLRFLSITLILLWIALFVAGGYLYLSALVSYCNGEYVDFAVEFVFSLIYILTFIEDAQQIPHYFYMMIHNHTEHYEDDYVPMMIYKDKKDS